MDWVANGFLIISVLLVRKKKIFCFLPAVMGNFLYIFVGLELNKPGLAFINIVFVFANISAWMEWRREKRYWNNLCLPAYKVRWWQIWR